MFEAKPKPRGALMRRHPLTLAVLAALAPWGAAQAETELATLRVTSNRDAATLGLDQPSSGASRTGIAARELPASFEAVDSRTIGERGDYAVTDAITRSTGLTGVGNNGNGGLSFSTRGFSGPDSVGVAENGARLATGAGTQTYPGDSWGYERIEVLRGPASIVYGSGTVGATINAVRKAPSRDASLETLAGIGTDGLVRLGVGAGGSLGDYASYRLDAYGRHSDGERDLGASRGGKLMSTLRFQPRSDLAFEVLADYSDQRPERYWGTPLADGRIDKSLRRENYNVEDAVVRYEDKRLRARAEWQASDWLTLRDEAYTLVANRHWKDVEQYSFNTAARTVDRSDYLEILHHMQQTGNRLEAAVAAGRHRVVAGWDIARVRFRHVNNFDFSGNTTVAARDPDHGSFLGGDLTFPKFRTATTLNALYLEDAWQAADRWLVLAGVRRDEADVSRRALVSGGADLDKKLAGTSWRLGVTHRLTADTSVYAQASTGYDPVTSVITLNLANRDFSLTRGTQVETGIKQSLGDGLGEWTAALYRIDKDDIITRDPANPSRSVQGGSQHSQGIELSAAVAPGKHWRFEGNVSFLKARFDELREDSGADRAGKRPPDVPEQVANLWSHYRFGAWQASLGVRYVGKRFADNANTVVLPSYVVADAGVAWRVDRRTTLRLFGRNLADKVYATNAYSNNQVILGEGRRFELVAEMKF